MSEFFVGLMSGTSMDGIDAALVEFNPTHSLPNPLPNSLQIIATHSLPYTATVKKDLFALTEPGPDEINRMGKMDQQLGYLFAQATNELITKAGVAKQKIKAIGSHGQTIRHQPDAPAPFTLQIGDPNIIALETGITTIADFRRKDVGLGGQGAPLTPSFHQFAFQCEQQARTVVNIGGMANLTVLSTDLKAPILGFDSGPGNILLDAWCRLHTGQDFDDDGLFSLQGEIQDDLLQDLLADPYFKKLPPKSTGKDYFNLNWLYQYLNKYPEFAPADIQATLVALTAHSMSMAIQQYSPNHAAIIVCGGGIYNGALMQKLKALMPEHTLHSSEVFGIAPNWLEAVAFAWLAQQTYYQKTGNRPSVTGATRASILGGIYYP